MAKCVGCYSTGFHCTELCFCPFAMSAELCQFYESFMFTLSHHEIVCIFSSVSRPLTTWNEFSPLLINWNKCWLPSSACHWSKFEALVCIYLSKECHRSPHQNCPLHRAAGWFHCACISWKTNTGAYSVRKANSANGGKCSRWSSDLLTHQLKTQSSGNQTLPQCPLASFSHWAQSYSVSFVGLEHL